MGVGQRSSLGVWSHRNSARAFVAHYRVSTDKQGQSGLGLDAQRAAVELPARSVGADGIAEFPDVESGRKADRTGLAAALALCRARRATLLFAKPGRLARSVALISNLMEGGVDFAAAVPSVNRLTVHLLAAAPQPSTPGGKARIIAAQARAVAAYGTVIQAARSAGALSLGDYAQALRTARLPVPRGGGRWSRPSVARVLRHCTSVEGGLWSGPNAVAVARRGAATGHPPEAP